MTMLNCNLRYTSARLQRKFFVLNNPGNPATLSKSDRALNEMIFGIIRNIMIPRITRFVIRGSRVRASLRAPFLKSALIGNFCQTFNAHIKGEQASR